MKISKYFLLFIIFILMCIYFIEIISSAQILFHEDFQDKNADGWNLESGWMIKSENNNDVLSGKGHSWARIKKGEDWTNYSFKGRVKLLKGDIHLNYRLTDSDQFSRYFVGFNQGGLSLHKQVGEQFTLLTESFSSYTTNRWYQLEIKGEGSHLQVYVDNLLALEYQDISPLRKGTIALETLDDSQVYVDDIEVSLLSELLKEKVRRETSLSSTQAQEKGGILRIDEIWSGEIIVTRTVIVPEGVTLTIKPGSLIKFKHYRGYQEPEKRVGLVITGGTLTAIGTPEEQIWFTSDAVEPINGDWNGIGLENTKDSKLDYVIVEFGEMGITQQNSKTVISNSIIRWSNAEGLYAERSQPLIVNNTLYGNGYHEIALEQYNQVKIFNNIIRDGHFGIHQEKTKTHIKGNYFKNEADLAITAGMESDVLIEENKFENIGSEPPIEFNHTCTVEMKNNDYGDGTVAIPQFDYQDVKRHELGYIPGDAQDKYPYIYEEVDETRRVVKRIGKDLYFGWALAFAEGKLWRFSLGSGEIGQQLDFIEIDPEGGNYKRYGNDLIMNPRGLTYDGRYFWVNDFSLLKIFKFHLKGDFIEIVDSFDIPDKELGGVSGLATDGTYLYLRSRDCSKVYRLDKQGNVVNEIYFEGGSLVWTGEYFWTNNACQKGIGKFDKKGNLVGSIYPAAKDTWAFAWDGKYLWTIQRTCEMWNDPKIYQIEILDDSLK